MASGSGDPAGAVTTDGEAEGVAADPAAALAPRERYRTLLGVAGVVILLDQVTKWWAVSALEGGRIIDLFWTLRFRLVRNSGASFSVGEGLTPLIAVAAMAVSAVLVVMARRVEQRSILMAMGLVLGGAVGNLIDRFVRAGDGFLAGAVVDFIDFQWWPVFNIADIAVVVGGLLLALLVHRHETRADGAASE